METKTSVSNRAWIFSHELKLKRYLRRNHHRLDIGTVFDLIFNESPDEGRKLVENGDMTDNEKKDLLVKWIYHEQQITCGIFGDQRYGKDALYCSVVEDVISYCKQNNFPLPRFVTLGNMRAPPFVKKEDMFFSFRNIPSGTKDQEVWIHCSEIDTALPSREGMSAENRLFSYLEGTMAQNHQKLFGCVKLASKVDINFIRSMNCKLFKFISPEKLSIEGVERDNLLSPLCSWLLPSNRLDKALTLLSFDNQLLTCRYDLPSWWTQQYSEQFCDIPMERLWDFIDEQMDNEMPISTIITTVSQKFRKKITREEITGHYEENESHID